MKGVIQIWHKNKQNYFNESFVKRGFSLFNNDRRNSAPTEILSIWYYRQVLREFKQIGIPIGTQGYDNVIKHCTVMVFRP